MGRMRERLSAAPRGEAERGDLSRLTGVPAIAALTTRPGAILILCDRIDADLAFFRAHFIQATLCLVTEDPALAAEAPPDIPVLCGPIRDRRWLRDLADLHGPSLVVDQRASDPGAQALAFAVFRRALAHGGVQALRLRTGRWARLGPGRGATRALDRRLAGAESLPALVPREFGRAEYRFATRAPREPRPIRLLAADEIPEASTVAPATTVEAPTYRRADGHLIDAAPWIHDSVATFAGHAVVPPVARVHRFREACVFGYGIVQVGGAIVDESLINRDRTHLLGALDLGPDGTGQVHHTLPRPRRIAGRTVHLWQMWAENYGHWLIECLPRLHVATRAGLLDEATKVAVQAVPGMADLYRDSLALAGIGADRIVWLTQGEVIFEELVYPAPVTRQPVFKSPLVIDAARALRDQAGASPEPLSERIYVSRNRSGRRRLDNEDAVTALLAARGYRVVHPETEPFARQIQIFAAARYVIGGMGAALSNLAFSPTGVRCLMLTNQAMLDDFFLDLVGLLEGTYVSIHGTSLSPDLGMHSDYAIALDTLSDALDAHGF